MSQYAEESSILTRKDKAEFSGSVVNFKYLGYMLYRSDNDWPEVLRNVGKARQVWSQLGKMLRIEGVGLQIS